MKSILKSILIISLFVFSQQIVKAQDLDKTVSIMVSGSGKTKEDAKQSAFRSAIEQAFGAFISSKTEILNDQVVVDQLASVANGNIQSFTILNEAQLPDGNWGVTLKTLVSVNNLTSFVAAKGIAIEVKGGLFALNIKQQLLNEQGEIKAITEMVSLLHEPMQISCDYIIKSGDPKSVDVQNKNWVIPLVVTATTNKNMDFCANYFIKTLSALSLTNDEVINYQNMQKSTYQLIVNYKGVSKTYYLRKRNSIDLLNTFTRQWGFYTSLFKVESGIDESNGNGFDLINDFGKITTIALRGNQMNQVFQNMTINFLNAGQQAASFTWNDKRTLAQIEQLTGYKVKPRGVVSRFKFGGIVVFEENGHGLVVQMTDLGEFKWSDANEACEQLVLNGYNDWRLPTDKDLEAIYFKLSTQGIGGFVIRHNSYNERSGKIYWSSTLDNYSARCIDFDDYWWSTKKKHEQGKYFFNRETNYLTSDVRAVRTF